MFVQEFEVKLSSMQCYIIIHYWLWDHGAHLKWSLIHIVHIGIKLPVISTTFMLLYKRGPFIFASAISTLKKASIVFDYLKHFTVNCSFTSHMRCHHFHPHTIPAGTWKQPCLYISYPELIIQALKVIVVKGLSKLSFLYFQIPPEQPSWLKTMLKLNTELRAMPVVSWEVKGGVCCEYNPIAAYSNIK